MKSASLSEFAFHAFTCQVASTKKDAGSGTLDPHRRGHLPGNHSGFARRRVAERAGVSVGTLYQYFPNKGTLLAGALRRHLCAVVEAVEKACTEVKGTSLETMAGRVVDAFVTAKMWDARTSRALYGVAAEVDAAAVVAQMAQRAQLALCDLLATAPGSRFGDLATVAYVWSTSMIGPIQGLLESEASDAAVSGVRDHLQRLAIAYLRGEATAERAA
jgi:AcrR family transcriptional regulator